MRIYYLFNFCTCMCHKISQNLMTSCTLMSAVYPLIHHICINSLVPSVKKINIGNPGIQVAGYLDFQYWFLCALEPAN